MHKGLYDCFKHWYHGGQIYLIGDPHFGDPEMQYLRKNYIGDEELVKRINSKVGKNDTIIILGDVGEVEWVSKLRGYKILIMGNHDKGASNYTRKYLDVITSDNEKMPIKVDNRLFDEVYEGCLIISDKIILSHEPVDFPYALNIHGHCHGHESKDEMHINLCAENIDYTPVSLKSIINSGRLKKIQNIHRECIDRATERKSKQFEA